jgi:hypothetical protein
VRQARDLWDSRIAGREIVDVKTGHWRSATGMARSDARRRRGAENAAPNEQPYHAAKARRVDAFTFMSAPQALLQLEAGQAEDAAAE